MKKHETRLLIGRIAFLTCRKSDTRHLICLHRFANENLLCGFSVCKSQYVYIYSMILSSRNKIDFPSTQIMSSKETPCSLQSLTLWRRAFQRAKGKFPLRQSVTVLRKRFAKRMHTQALLRANRKFFILLFLLLPFIFSGIRPSLRYSKQCYRTFPQF